MSQTKSGFIWWRLLHKRGILDQVSKKSSLSECVLLNHKNWLRVTVICGGGHRLLDFGWILEGIGSTPGLLTLRFLLELSVEEPFVDLDAGEASGLHGLFPDAAVPLAAETIIKLGQIFDLAVGLLSAADTMSSRWCLVISAHALARDDWFNLWDGGNLEILLFIAHSLDVLWKIVVQNVVDVDAFLTGQWRGKFVVVWDPWRLHKWPKLIAVCSMAVGHAHLVVMSGIFGSLLIIVVEKLLELRLILKLNNLDVDWSIVIVVRE